jgi:hypothetical protein
MALVSLPPHKFVCPSHCHYWLQEIGKYMFEVAPTGMISNISQEEHKTIENYCHKCTWEMSICCVRCIKHKNVCLVFHSIVKKIMVITELIHSSHSLPVLTAYEISTQIEDTRNSETKANIWRAVLSPITLLRAVYCYSLLMFWI